MEFQLSYFKSSKMMLWKCCTQYASKFETQQWPQDWKRSIFIPIPKKGNAKECSNYHTITLISHASKVMLKILQARLQPYVNHEVPDVQAGFRKGRGTRDQIAKSTGSSKKQESSRKTSTFALLTTPKPLTVWITTKWVKFFKRWEYQTILPVSWEIWMQVKKQQLEPDLEKQTGSNLGKEYVKAVNNPGYLTYVQSTSWETLGWMKHKLESQDCREKYQ